MKEERTLELLQRGHSKAVNSLLATGSALLLSSVLLIVLLSLLMRGKQIDDAIVQAKIVAANSNAVLMFADEKAGREILHALRAAPSIESAGIFAANGTPLAQYQIYGAKTVPAPSELLKRETYAFGLKYLDVAQPVSNHQEVIGAVMLRYDLSSFYQRLLGYAGLIMLVALGALMIVYFFVSRMRMAVSRAELHLDFLAHSDPITALPNRRAFNQRLDEALVQGGEESVEVGLILMDLDNFKVVNDTMGHHCGDEILRMVAQRLNAAARTTDTVCRIGGDEFVIIMRQRDQVATDLEGITRRFMRILAQPFSYQEQEFFLTASFGCSLFPRDARDSQTLIRKADTAMYSAKLEGKNTFAVFEQHMDALAQRRLMLENNLRKALEKQELTLHYQPQIDLKTGRIVGVEALLRWQHPDMGAISPSEFIPVAEDSGQIIEIGKWVLREACRQMVLWREARMAPLRMAVNLSARQFKDQALMQTINQALETTGLSPLLLDVEITEGLLMENLQSNIPLMQAMRESGISLSIDDFGTGYSSLSYLKRFPINQLKIDRSFMHDIPGEGNAFITAIIAMAHSLGLLVVAEGVETPAQMQFLREAGCDVAQGYLFARPMSPDQLAELLSAGVITLGEAPNLPSA